VSVRQAQGNGSETLLDADLQALADAHAALAELFD